MHTTLRFLMVLLCGCDTPLPGVEVPAKTQTVLSECADDTQCPDGMKCQSCGENTARVCVPGCRADSDCLNDQICNHNIACTTCPCSPGWCEINPCLDLDSDGYVQSPDPDVKCEGKKPGDCNDANPAIHPEATEKCGDYTDNNCNGHVDEAPFCNQCASYADRCATSLDLYDPAKFCVKGCAAACPAVTPAKCEPGYCATPGGLDQQNGCRLDEVCKPCDTCTDAWEEVCGVDFVTYRNPCRAARAGIEVLHRGACLTREGSTCVDHGYRDCGNANYQLSCRTSDNVCTRVGTCNVADDCPNGLTPKPRCSDNTVGKYGCVAHQCVVACGR